MNTRYCHHWKQEEKFSGVHCKTISVDDNNVSFKDMYNFYTYKDFGRNKAVF